MRGGAIVHFASGQLAIDEIAAVARTLFFAKARWPDEEKVS